jgi:hypothetical protein
MGLLFAIAADLRQRSHSQVRVPRDSQIRDSPNLEGQVPVFISPSHRVARLYPPALGSLFIASYDSQSYGGGIRPRFHTGDSLNSNSLASFFCTNRTGNIVPNNSSIVACVCSRGNLFAEPRSSKGRLLSLPYFGLQQSCHNMLKLVHISAYIAVTALMMATCHKDDNCNVLREVRRAEFPQSSLYVAAFSPE